MGRGFRKPDTTEVSRMFTVLLGRTVKVAKGSRVRTGARDRWTLGVFVAEDDTVVGVCATDVPMAAHTGAALSLFPPHKAKSCIEENIIEDNIWENTCEVYNVVSRFFDDTREGMVHLGASYPDGAQVPDDVRQFMRRSRQRVDLRVQIAGYGTGALALIA